MESRIRGFLYSIPALGLGGKGFLSSLDLKNRKEHAQRLTGGLFFISFAD
jgi:hypothetical protein